MTPDPAALATALVTRDAAGMGAAITDTVRMRSLLPSGPVEDHGRDAVLARLDDWFADKDAIEIIEVRSEQIVDKLLLHYRMTIIQGSYRWACTQTLVARIDDDRLSVIDLLCSGLREF
jgi:hypothetical protein